MVENTLLQNAKKLGDFFTKPIKPSQETIDKNNARVRSLGGEVKDDWEADLNNIKKTPLDFSNDYKTPRQPEIYDGKSTALDKTKLQSTDKIDQTADTTIPESFKVEEKPKEQVTTSKPKINPTDEIDQTADTTIPEDWKIKSNFQKIKENPFVQELGKFSLGALKGAVYSMANTQDTGHMVGNIYVPSHSFGSGGLQMVQQEYKDQSEKEQEDTKIALQNQTNQIKQQHDIAREEIQDAKDERDYETKVRQQDFDNIIKERNARTNEINASKVNPTALKYEKEEKARAEKNKIAMDNIKNGLVQSYNKGGKNLVGQGLFNEKYNWLSGGGLIGSARGDRAEFLNMKNIIDSTTVENLKEILGSQYTEKEGELLKELQSGINLAPKDYKTKITSLYNKMRTSNGLDEVTVDELFGQENLDDK